MDIRICQILSGDLWAGAEVMAYNLIKTLAKTLPPDNLHIVLLNHGRLADELQGLQIAVTILDEQQYSFRRLMFETRRIVQGFRPNIIHAHRYKENILALLSAKPAGNVPVVATQHGMPESTRDPQGLKQLLLRKTLLWIQARFLNRVVCVSHDLKENMIHHLGFTPEKLNVIHNGIELDPSESKPAAQDIGHRFGSAGRLFPVKDYPFFVEIARAVIHYNANARFMLAGDGPEKEKICQKIAQNDLKEHFVLLGHLDNMSSFYSGLDVYVNTSIHEGIPMSILEAMSHGLPVIAPKTGGMVEIVRDGVEGFLVDGRSVDQFCMRCRQLLKDQNLLRQMGCAARKRVHDMFSVKVMTKQYLDLYAALIKKS